MLAPDDCRHGTTNGYRIGCRCDDCRAAKQIYRRGHVQEINLAAAVPQEHVDMLRALREVGGIEALSRYCSEEILGLPYPPDVA